MTPWIKLTALALAAALLPATASHAGVYPVAPPGSTVTLQPADFVQYVPDHSPELNEADRLIGDTLDQHPGGFCCGGLGYLVGVFGHSFDAADPGYVRLWETTGGSNNDNMMGPQITLGHWDGTAFTAYGVSVNAVYNGTGTGSFGFEVTASATPLAEFRVGGHPVLNAVMLDTTGAQMPQVTAAAIDVVPEPSSVVLQASALGVVRVMGWRRRKTAGGSAAQAR
jgi:hypothetical protein